MKKTIHPMPPKKVRRKEVIQFIGMGVGDSLLTDGAGVAAIMQYGYRHGMAARSRRETKSKWRVWRAQ